MVNMSRYFRNSDEQFKKLQQDLVELFSLERQTNFTIRKLKTSVIC